MGHTTIRFNDFFQRSKLGYQHEKHEFTFQTQVANLPLACFLLPIEVLPLFDSIERLSQA